ncbi:hypothetical protein S40293_02197 [Stachybotrys chartarum IBT 40293]|nr:hypothetical protein S40293_02197 [Stachybotrys chartarum IBT 40293]KFA80623.1 hypothetical protein S40288_07529 [Stachybotrys chartarum IBT 40288]
MDQARLKIIEDNSIEGGLDFFRATFDTTCQNQGIQSTPNSIAQLPNEDLQNLAVDLLLLLQNLRVTRLLPSSGSSKNLLSDLSRLNSSVNSNDFDPDHIKPLLHTILDENTNDALVWKQPADANQAGVLSWFSTIIGELEDLANEHKPTLTLWRRPLAQPNKPTQGSTAERNWTLDSLMTPMSKRTLDAIGRRSWCHEN